MKRDKDLMDTINYHITSLIKYIDRSILCDGVGVHSTKCDELLKLKAHAENLLVEVGEFCYRANKIANS